MHSSLLFGALLLVAVAVCTAAPQSRTKLQFGSNDVEVQPFVEEVVVKAVLNVRSPGERQARTRTNLRDGTTVTESKNSRSTS